MNDVRENTSHGTRAALSAPPYLSIADLVVAYDTLPVLARVELQVPRGELFALVGASGSGKSTLLLSIAGFIPVRSGTIQLAGKDLTRLPANQREIGMVFQGYTLFPHKSVFENIAYSLRVRKQGSAEIRHRVTTLIELLRLEGLERRFPRQLSGGQQQRVALARALAFSPQLLLLDEPLAAIDRRLRSDLQAEIKRVQRATGATLVYVTHDQKEAMAISDRMGVLYAGKIAQAGPPREIYRNPVNAEIADFLGGANLLPVDVVDRAASSCSVRLGGQSVEGIPCPAWLTTTPAKAVLMVRPEHWRIATAVDAGQPRFKGSIREVAFEGDSASSRVHLLDVGEVILRRSADELSLLIAGEEVLLELNPAEARLFKSK